VDHFLQNQVSLGMICQPGPFEGPLEIFQVAVQVANDENVSRPREVNDPAPSARGFPERPDCPVERGQEARGVGHGLVLGPAKGLHKNPFPQPAARQVSALAAGAVFTENTYMMVGNRGAIRKSVGGKKGRTFR
jgi:hypothetical protein